MKLVQQRSIVHACLYLLISAMISCALLDHGDEEEATSDQKLSRKDQEKLAEYKAEVTLGRDMSGRLLQYYGIYGNEEVVAYVNQVGNYVARNGDYPQRRYMFAILDTPSINAFACPGGYILVTLGALRLARTEAELAMILGHEIAHVGLQHMFNTLKKMDDREMKKSAEKTQDQGADGKVYETEVRRRPVAGSSDSAALISRYLSQSAGTGMTLLRAAKAGMNVLLEQGLDKKLEFEADEVGVSWAIRAGYDPVAMLNFLSRLDKQKKNGKSSVKILEKTHPKVADRKEKLVRMLRDIDAGKIIGARGSDRFQKVMKVIHK